MPSGPLRRALRAAGHRLAPVLQVGKEGVSDAVLAALDVQLAAHELVKVKVGGESPEDRFLAAERLGEGTRSAVAQVLGRTVLVYRRHPERPRFEPGAAPAGRPPVESGRSGRTAPPGKGGRRTRRVTRPARSRR
jgi:RNA-binding protein